MDRHHVFPCLPRTGHVIATTCTKRSVSGTSARLALSVPLKLMKCVNKRQTTQSCISGGTGGLREKPREQGPGVSGNVDDESAMFDRPAV